MNPTFMHRIIVLIETLWNVKQASIRVRLCGRFVLIETLWNVKMVSSPFDAFSREVLIETLWNVKCCIFFRFFFFCFCINRNIVECKDKGRTETH